MPSRSVTVAALTHDLVRKRSVATLTWDDDAEKRVAFGCNLDQVRTEAEKALRDLSAETATIAVNSAK
jgi:hypothetical protein